jgi:energy-coupling factor transport system permease protein
MACFDDGIDPMMSLEARTKLLVTLAYAVMLMMTVGFAALAIESVAICLLVLALRLTHPWLKTLRVLLPMTAFLVVVMVFSFDLITALTSALRLAALTTAFFIFFQTTAPEDLANALVKTCPERWRRSGAPFAFAFILTTAMQFIPVLARKMQDVMDAQRARGIRLERDLASVRNYPALFTPLLIQSFTLADQLAEAMEARGFGAPRRTFAETYSLRGVDYLALGLALTLVFVGWQLR